MPIVIYVDNHLLIAAKPAGMLSQADETGDLDMLSWGKDWIKHTYQKPGAVFLGLVHRLDRPASGLMVMARTSKAARRLSEQFRNHLIEKKYIAIVSGVPPQQATWEDFLVKTNRISSVATKETPGAKRAALSFHRLASESGFSMVAITLETGRAHQIRLQFASRGFPILGDFRYGSSSELDGQNLALHAYQLTLEHPVRREVQTWSLSPPKTWNPFFQKALKELNLAQPPEESQW